MTGPNTALQSCAGFQNNEPKYLIPGRKKQKHKNPAIASAAVILDKPNAKRHDATFGCVYGKNRIKIVSKLSAVVSVGISDTPLGHLQTFSESSTGVPKMTAAKNKPTSKDGVAAAAAAVTYPDDILNMCTKTQMKKKSTDYIARLGQRRGVSNGHLCRPIEQDDTDTETHTHQTSA